MPFHTGLKTILFFWVFVLAGMSADAVEIRLKPLVRLQSSIVLLGDVAEFPGMDAERANRWRRLELFPAPAVGTTRNVRHQEIRELLELNGVDAADFSLTGPAVVQIHTDRHGGGGGAGDGHRWPVPRPPGRRELRTRLSPKYASVVVATRNLERGEVVREADVELRTVDGPVRGVDAVAQLRDAVGFEVVRSIATGQALDSRSLQRPILIRRGQAVTVCARAQGVSVRTTAKALGEGSRDDLIMLESMETKQKYTARVVGPQQAEVYALGSPVSRLSSAPAPATPLR